MAVTVKQVYDIALVLMDEVIETGRISPDNPDYYKAKTYSIVTTLQAELLPKNIVPSIITDLSQILLLSDRISLSVLPYGLAAHLLIQEDVNAASYFNGRYDELKRKIPTTVEPIIDVYDVTGGMR